MSQLLAEIKDRFLSARKQKDDKTRNLLSVVIGEVDALVNSPRRPKILADEHVVSIVLKLIASNKETLKEAEKVANAAQITKLNEENSLLNEFLPCYWSIEEVKKSFADKPIYQAIMSETNQGKAIGLAVKFLKEINAPVDGKTVSEAVISLRS